MVVCRPAVAAPGLGLVVLDPGHGGANLGAPDRHRPGRFEKSHTLRIVRLIAEDLRAAGVQVLLTRDEDRAVALRARVNLANRRRADVFLSVHLNATERPGPTGHETFFLNLDASDEAARRLAAFENEEGGTVAAAAARRPTDDVVGQILLDLTQNRAHHDAARLAALIQAQLRGASPFPDRGVKQAPFVVLMGAAMPAVVVEVGFINHAKEGLYITSPAGQTRIAGAIARGVLDFGRLVLAPQQQTGAHHEPP